MHPRDTLFESQQAKTATVVAQPAHASGTLVPRRDALWHAHDARVSSQALILLTRCVQRDEGHLWVREEDYGPLTNRQSTISICSLSAATVARHAAYAVDNTGAPLHTVILHRAAHTRRSKRANETWLPVRNHGEERPAQTYYCRSDPLNSFLRRALGVLSAPQGDRERSSETPMPELGVKAPRRGEKQLEPTGAAAK
ncbi:hypothetical protein MRX96_011622 [Rhipicephalus microplus]